MGTTNVALPRRRFPQPCGVAPSSSPRRVVFHGFDVPRCFTSIDANPQLSIYGIVNCLLSPLARRLSGQAVQLA